MTIQDQVIGALAAYREDRGGGTEGMQAVLNVLQNRAIKNRTSVYTEATKHLQISSLTAPGNPELDLWAQDTDLSWQGALALAVQMAAGTLADITGGAVDYYDPPSIKTTATFVLPNGDAIPFPMGWNPTAVTYTCTIQGQVYFK